MGGRRRDRTWADTAAEPRGCLRCQERKPAERFPPHGRRGGGVTRVCWACVEGEAWALEEAHFKPRLRLDWLDVDGRYRRFCVSCRTFMVRDAKHFPPIYRGTGLARTCRKCRSKMSVRARDRQREREGEQMRALHAKQARDRRKLPEVKRREAAARKRWREKLKATPEGRARMLETERMSRRLKREREGVPLDEQRKLKATMSKDPSPRVDAAPLVVLIEGLRRRREAVAGLIDDAEGASVAAVCEDLELSPRRYFAWRSGEYRHASLALAERVILNAGVTWQQVYSRDDHPELYAVLPEGVA